MQNCPAELHVYKMTGREGREGVGGKGEGEGREGRGGVGGRERGRGGGGRDKKSEGGKKR